MCLLESSVNWHSRCLLELVAWSLERTTLSQGTKSVIATLNMPM